MISRIGELVDRIKGSVVQRNIDPHSNVVVRIGDTGPEMQIEHVKVRNGFAGPILILQLKAVQ